MVRFDTKALYAALDAQCHERGMTWTQLAVEIGVSAATITRTRLGGRMEVDDMLAMVRWLGVPVETFVRESTPGLAQMDARALAREFAVRLSAVLPRGFYATADDDQVHIGAPDGLGSGGWVGVVDQDPAENPDAPCRYESAAWNVLSTAQDVVSETTRMPWPPARGAKLDVALPGYRRDQNLLHIWYGDERDPALTLPPIDLSGTPGQPG